MAKKNYESGLPSPPPPPSLRDTDTSPKMGMNEFLSGNASELRKAGRYMETGFKAWVAQDKDFPARLTVSGWNAQVKKFLGKE